MKLRGTEFGRVTGASGVQGFFGRGYWFHRQLPPPLRPNFDGAAFVAKTTTLPELRGNMALRGPEEDFEPRERFPACVWAHPSGIALNAVGLSGPGAQALLDQGKWQEWPKPFMLSFMSLAPTKAERLEELRQFTALLLPRLREFRSPAALQINFSCPNTKHEWTKDTADLVREMEDSLETAGALGIPLLPKVNTAFPPEAAARIMLHPGCDALCIANTIPWKDWDASEKTRYFGTTKSPLAGLQNPWGEKIPDGGVSGKPLLPHVRQWLIEARRVGISKPLNVGGGVLSLADAEQLLRLAPENSSVFLGSIAFLRPWRVGPIIRKLNAA